MTTRVIHVKELPNFPDAVYIGRRNNRSGLAESPFANPFPIGHDPTGAYRGEVIAAYRKHLLKSPELLRALPELRNRPLACWCRYDGVPKRDKNACHGDVLVELLETYTDEELRAMGT